MPTSKPFRHSAGFGKRIEYWIVGRMLKEGLDVYLPLVDDDAIDAVIRRPDGTFTTVQIKARSKGVVERDAALWLHRPPTLRRAVPDFKLTEPTYRLPEFCSGHRQGQSRLFQQRAAGGGSFRRNRPNDRNWQRRPIGRRRAAPLRKEWGWPGTNNRRPAIGVATGCL